MAAELVNVGQAVLSFRALEMAGANPRAMPGFEEAADLDQEGWFDVASFNWRLASNIHLRVHWDAAKERFLELAFSVVYR